MKIQILNHVNKPIAHSRIQIQVKGKNSGYLSFTTDSNGFFELNEKYKGQQVAASFGGEFGQSLIATDGLKLKVEAIKEKVK